jgi:hypothetical protein
VYTDSVAAVFVRRPGAGILLGAPEVK